MNRIPESCPSATARVRASGCLPVPTRCNCCGAPVRCVHHSEHYGKIYSDWPWLYACTACDASVGLHPRTELPLGLLADKATRQARKQAKERFNRLWQQGDISRTGAYAWLARKLRIPVDACHFGQFDVARCRQADAILATWVRRKPV